jgi:F1F0 ATPase subunit 2
MTESIALHVLIAFVAGLLLGLFYFGSLWLTVQSLVKAKRPAMLSIASFFVRTGITLGGFFIIMSGHWERALACMFGFLVMRRVLTHRYGFERQALQRKKEQA